VGKKGEEKKNLGRVTLQENRSCENEGGKALIYTWEPRVTPLGCSPSVNHIALLSISTRGPHFLGF
jgi:hypothetical protein